MGSTHGLLGRHDSGDPRDAENVALLASPESASVSVSARMMMRPSATADALRRVLGGDVDHRGLAGGARDAKGLAFATMRQSRARACHARVAMRRRRRLLVAAVTSFWRIRLSPTSTSKSHGLEAQTILMRGNPAFADGDPVRGNFAAAFRTHPASVSKFRRSRLLIPTSLVSSGKRANDFGFAVHLDKNSMARSCAARVNCSLPRRDDAGQDIKIQSAPSRAPHKPGKDRTGSPCGDKANDSCIARGDQIATEP